MLYYVLKFALICAMDSYSRWLVSLYALAFVLWSIAIPNTETPSVHFQESSSAEQSVSTLSKSGNAFLLSQNSFGYSGSFRTEGNNDTIHFFHYGTFQYVFLKSIFATAFTLLKANEINFEFIDLIYPFHYFW